MTETPKNVMANSGFLPFPPSSHQIIGAKHSCKLTVRWLENPALHFDGMNPRQLTRDFRTGELLGKDRRVYSSSNVHSTKKLGGGFKYSYFHPYLEYSHFD